MLDLTHKKRWVFGPLDSTGLPVAREYALQWNAPMHHNGHALTLCAMNAHQLASARQDPRLTVLESIHGGTVHAHVVDHHADLISHAGKFPGEKWSLHDFLVALAKHHHCFEPEY